MSDAFDPIAAAKNLRVIAARNFDDNSRPDWQQRVIREKKELDEKIDRLSTYLGTTAYKDLFAEDQRLLSTQLKFMRSYSAILGTRVSRF